uniref:Cytochrome c oxidase subunit 2 n=1 Tax=Callinectes sapidus TaxID=6763 RepID=Q67EP4_CALSI|nr:cytochrome c oxidase subunit II [Callinectes sapidus]AAR16545.1 cytochrome c oxidase subunit II [Callinectes sapidus]QCQ20619.1 cytochrome c oxidase subunit II [Callinectes sapidus]QCQ20632.1 cytochrome c oxidase subunit II [Callinectes sapidus]QCQ20645.1 cytochrome c oxidase subunit II [Callinectes sapidus]QCQ20658.1 cytochrome c oxidase subunit II [Callinectes sapidus]
MATWTFLSLQDSASPLMEQLIFFHDHIMVVLIMIITFVGYMMASILTNSFINRYMLENQTIELIWTALPAIILIFIALPSLRLLYLLDEVNNPSVTLKTVGHQWYWSYEYSDFMNVEFDSYMTPTNELADSGFRLLEVDNRTVLPMNTQIRVVITAADVIHSWTVPALGVKADAIPGRLNQVSFMISRPGLFYGQCSEICGANHSFMPIVIESVNTNSFLNWISSCSD